MKPSMLQDQPLSSMDFCSSSFFTRHKQELPTPAAVKKQAKSRPHQSQRLPVMFPQLGLLVKFGHQVSIMEAQNLVEIRTSIGTLVPIPEVYGWRVFNGEVFIYMELIQGDTLHTRWSSLAPQEKSDICEQLRGILTALRTVKQPPADQFIGSISRGPLRDCVFESIPPTGPYPTIAKFHDWFAQLPQQFLPSEQRLTDPHRSYLPDTGRPTLTHGDLHRGNILISSVWPTRIIDIVDWAQAGWYPDYWEFCKARYTAFFNEEWSTMWIPKFLESREDELYAFSYFTMAIGAV